MPTVTMMRPVARLTSAGVAMISLLLPIAAVCAQSFPASSQGEIEVIGLRHWTIRMLEDSLAVKAPGESLQSHACAAVLQQKLGFPAAAVSIEMSAAPGAGGFRKHVLITLVEPQDSAVVQFHRLVGARKLPREQWGALRAEVQDSSGLRLNELLFAVQLYGKYRDAPDSAANMVTQVSPDLLPIARGIWRELARVTAPTDLSVALRAARDDMSWQNRVIALSVLANFSAQDRTWHALAGALRDPEERVRSAAAAVLQGFLNRPVRRVDWHPAKADLRALLAGTNVWDYRTLLLALSKTAIDPQLAPALLRGNTAMLLAHLRAQSPRAHEPALALVQRLAGQSALGRDDAIEWAGSR